MWVDQINRIELTKVCLKLIALVCRVTIYIFFLNLKVIVINNSL